MAILDPGPLKSLLVVTFVTGQGHLPFMGVRVTLFTRPGEPHKTGLSEFCSGVTTRAFDALVLARQGKRRTFAVNIGNPAAVPAVFAVTLLARLGELAGVRVVMTEAAVSRHLDKLNLGKSRALEGDRMALVTFQTGVMSVYWTFRVLRHIVTGQALHLVLSVVHGVEVRSIMLSLISKFMTVQASDIHYTGIRVNLFVVTQLFATKLRSDEFTVVNLHLASFKHFRRHVVTIQALRFDQRGKACPGF